MWLTSFFFLLVITGRAVAVSSTRMCTQPSSRTVSDRRPRDARWPHTSGCRTRSTSVPRTKPTSQLTASVTRSNLKTSAARTGTRLCVSSERSRSECFAGYWAPRSRSSGLVCASLNLAVVRVGSLYGPRTLYGEGKIIFCRLDAISRFTPQSHRA